MTTIDRTETTPGPGDLTPGADPDASRAAETASESTGPIGEGEDTGESAPNREAARYRRRLRATEAERDGLRAQVESLQRAEVERVARTDGHLTRPSALWASGVSLADLVAQDGTVDRERVMTAVGAAVDRLGLATVRAPRPDPSQGARGGATSAQTWDSFLKANTR